MIDYTGKRSCIVCRRLITWGCNGCWLGDHSTHAPRTRPYTLAELQAARAETAVGPGEYPDGETPAPAGHRPGA